MFDEPDRDNGSGRDDRRDRDGGPDLDIHVFEGLIRGRNYIRAATKRLNLEQALKILSVMDEFRRLRADDTWAPPRRPSTVTLVAAQSEIAWRADTLPPGDAVAIVRVVNELLPFLAALDGAEGTTGPR